MNLAVTVSPALDGRFTGRKMTPDLQLSQCLLFERQNASRTAQTLAASQTPDATVVSGATEQCNRCIISGRVAGCDVGYDDRGGRTTQLLLQIEGDLAPLPVRFAEEIDPGLWMGCEVLVEGCFRVRNIVAGEGLHFLPYIFVRNFQLSVQKLGS